VRPKTGAFRKLKPYSMTNWGLEIELPLCPLRVSGRNQLAILNCVSEDFPSKNISIYLVPERDEMDMAFNKMLNEGDFKRILCHKLEFLKAKDVASRLQTIYVQRAAITSRQRQVIRQLNYRKKRKKRREFRREPEL
jgi:hypothetical protein